ncbi:MAG: tetratricopeptide repeat protein [Planctomycetota bacterium]
MPIQTMCPQCSQPYNLKDDLAGKTVKCKKCGRTFTIPKAGPPSATPPAQPQPAPPPTGAEIQFTCPQCGGKVSITPDIQGQAVTCPYCNKIVTAPGEETPEAIAAALAREAAAHPPAPPMPPTPPPAEAPPPAQQPAPPPVRPAPVAGQQPPAPPQPEAQAEEAKGGGFFKKALITLAALLVVIGIGLGGMFGYRHLHEMNPATHLQRAKEAMNASNFDAAKREFEKAIELKKDGPYIEAEVGLAEMFEKTNQPEEAIKAYKKLIELDKGNTAHYQTLGKIYENQGKRKEAIEIYEGAVVIRKDDPAGYRSLAEVCIKWADECKDPKEAAFFIDKAIVMCNEILRLEPKDDATVVASGFLLMKKGDAPKAEVRFKEALKINKDNARAHHGLGQLYKNRAFYEPAFQEMQEALRLDRSLMDARLDIAEIYVTLGKGNEAVAWCKNVADMLPKSSKAHQYLGNVYFNNNMLDEAATALKKACDLDPGNAEAQTLFTQVQQRGGKPKK